MAVFLREVADLSAVVLVTQARNGAVTITQQIKDAALSCVSHCCNVLAVPSEDPPQTVAQLECPQAVVQLSERDWQAVAALLHSVLVQVRLSSIQLSMRPHN